MTPRPFATSAAAPRPAWRRIDLFAVAVRFQSVIGLVLVAIGGVIFSPRRHGLILFLAPDNMANIVRAVSETGIIAVGMTFVIITAGIDLSVGALLSLSSVLTATIMTTAGWGLIPTVLFVVACGDGVRRDPGLASRPASGWSRSSSRSPDCRSRAGWRSSSPTTSTSTFPTAMGPDSRRPSSPSSATGSSTISCRWRRWCSSSSRPSRLSCSTSPASAATCSRSAATSAPRASPACR